MRSSNFLPPTLLLLGVCAALAPSCGPDAPPLECPEPHPSFDVLIVAPDGPLPADTVVNVEYGGGSETYEANTPGARQVVFCEPAAADGGALPPLGSGGQPSAAGAGGEENGGAAGLAGSAGGAGGEGGGTTPRATAPLPGIRCQLWTQGPATVTVDTHDLYANDEHELRLSTKVCTVVETIELERPEDAGMM